MITPADRCSAFRQLETFHLAVSGDTELDVSALQFLPCLETVALDTGEFTTEAMPPNLTSLLLVEAVLDGPQDTGCMTSLKKLSLSQSRWSCNVDLPRFSLLEGLTCLRSIVSLKDETVFEHQLMAIPS